MEEAREQREAEAKDLTKDTERYAKSSFLDIFINYCVSGIDFSLAGNGGPDCRDIISSERRTAETVLGLIVACTSLFIGLKMHTPPRKIVHPHPHQYAPARIVLLMCITFVFALEICYKLATRQAVFVFQPCHMLCIVHMILLASPATNPRFHTYLFRLHIYFLHGPIMAMIFPVTNTLFLPFEVTTYWLEHIFIVIIPFYLLRHGGVFTMERTSDISWAFISYGAWLLYHFAFLEPLSLFTLANLNSMLCPAISDPFYGPNYRLWAILHQFVLVTLSGKLFGLIGISEEQAAEDLEKESIKSK